MQCNCNSFIILLVFVAGITFTGINDDYFVTMRKAYVFLKFPFLRLYLSPLWKHGLRTFCLHSRENYGHVVFIITNSPASV